VRIVVLHDGGLFADDEDNVDCKYIIPKEAADHASGG